MEPEKKSNGATVGLIVIIIILIIGGIYIWKVNEKAAEKKAVENATVTTEDTTELNALEQELNALDADANLDVNDVE